MSEAFAPHAARLCGALCRALGWLPGDFWNATPAEIATICGAGDDLPGNPLSRAEFEHLMEQDEHG